MSLSQLNSGPLDALQSILTIGRFCRQNGIWIFPWIIDASGVGLEFSIWKSIGMMMEEGGSGLVMMESGRVLQRCEDGVDQVKVGVGSIIKTGVVKLVEWAGFGWALGFTWIRGCNGLRVKGWCWVRLIYTRDPFGFVFINHKDPKCNKLKIEGRFWQSSKLVPRTFPAML